MSNSLTLVKWEKSISSHKNQRVTQLEYQKRALETFMDPLCNVRVGTSSWTVVKWIHIGIKKTTSKAIHVEYINKCVGNWIIFKNKSKQTKIIMFFERNIKYAQ